MKNIKKIFQDLEKCYVFFGLGVNAFNRIGPENFLENYHILSLRDPLENKLIKKDIKIFALEEGIDNKHLNAPRNSNTVIKHPKTQAYIQKHSQEKQPVFIVYKPFLAMQKIAKDKKWILATNPYKFGKQLFENKILFRDILQKMVLPVPPGTVCKNTKELTKNFSNFQKKYGSPLVIQHPTRGGGRGTFFINNKKELEKILPALQETKILVLKYVKGISPSITGCVTPWKIFHTFPQYQVLDMPECYNLETKMGDGLWCGHDWSFSAKNIDQKTAQQAYRATKKVGEYLKKKGYKGIFGLDFIQDEKTGTLYIGECNPRLLGSFPALTMVQLKNKEVPILALHLLSFLNLTKEQNNIMRHMANEIQELMKTPKQGAQLVIHNQECGWARNQSIIKPGVYIVKKNQLHFVRPGYKLEHLKQTNEFLLSDGLPHKNDPFSPNRRIMRLITQKEVLLNHYQLNPWSKEAARISYKSLKIVKVKLFRLKRFFNPRFMLKG
jgi:predicted ATP-grasp superfamily ATP-dependent carboligase